MAKHAIAAELDIVRLAREAVVRRRMISVLLDEVVSERGGVSRGIRVSAYYKRPTYLVYLPTYILTYVAYLLAWVGVCTQYVGGSAGGRACGIKVGVRVYRPRVPPLLSWGLRRASGGNVLVHNRYVRRVSRYGALTQAGRKDAGLQASQGIRTQ